MNEDLALVTSAIAANMDAVLAGTDLSAPEAGFIISWWLKAAAAAAAAAAEGTGLNSEDSADPKAAGTGAADGVWSASARFFLVEPPASKWWDADDLRFRTDRSVGDGESAAEDDGGEDGGVDEDAVDGAGDELDECRGMESRRGDSISSKNSKKISLYANVAPLHTCHTLHTHTPGGRVPHQKKK